MGDYLCNLRRYYANEYNASQSVMRSLEQLIEAIRAGSVKDIAIGSCDLIHDLCYLAERAPDVRKFTIGP